MVPIFVHGKRIRGNGAKGFPVNVHSYTVMSVTCLSNGNVFFRLHGFIWFEG